MTSQTLGRGLPRGRISESTEYFHEFDGGREATRKERSWYFVIVLVFDWIFAYVSIWWLNS